MLLLVCGSFGCFLMVFGSFGANFPMSQNTHFLCYFFELKYSSVLFFYMTGFSLDSAAGNETLLLILDVYFAQAFVTGHCHLIRCSEIYHNFYQLSQSVKLAK